MPDDQTQGVRESVCGYFEPIAPGGSGSGVAFFVNTEGEDVRTSTACVAFDKDVIEAVRALDEGAYVQVDGYVAGAFDFRADAIQPVG